MVVIRAEKEGIEFFTVEATGESGMSQRGLAKLCGVHKNTISSLIKNLSEKAPAKTLDPSIGKDYKLSEEIKRGGKANILKIEFCAAVIQHYCSNNNPKVALQSRNSLNKLLSLGLIRPQHLVILETDNVYPSTNEGIEAKIRNRLALTLQGVREVGCAAGRIDVLTPLELIEVKKIKHWKAAIGQVLVYSAYYPQHKKRIHLYGVAHSSLVTIIKTHCDRLNIRVTFENVAEEV